MRSLDPTADPTAHLWGGSSVVDLGPAVFGLAYASPSGPLADMNLPVPDGGDPIPPGGGGGGDDGGGGGGDGGHGDGGDDGGGGEEEEDEGDDEGEGGYNPGGAAGDDGTGWIPGDGGQAPGDGGGGDEPDPPNVPGEIGPGATDDVPPTTDPFPPVDVLAANLDWVLPTVVVISQLDTAVPGPADALAVGVAVAVGVGVAVWAVYDLMSEMPDCVGPEMHFGDCMLDCGGAEGQDCYAYDKPPEGTGICNIVRFCRPSNRPPYPP